MFNLLPGARTVRKKKTCVCLELEVMRNASFFFFQMPLVIKLQECRSKEQIPGSAHVKHTLRGLCSLEVI